MAKKAFIILLASQKGGVGKTAVCLNLAVALRMMNYSVLLVDTDIESASLTEQLSIKSETKGYMNVLNNEAKLNDVVFAYEPINLYVIPGNQVMENGTVKPGKLAKFYSELAKLDFDFIIIDSPPGLFSEEVVRYVNDVAIVTTPDSVSSAASAKMAQHCEKHRIEHRLIINRVGYSKYDLDRETVERLYGDISFSAIPDDRIVEESIMKHKPAFMIDRNSDFSVAIAELAREYSLRMMRNRGEDVSALQAERESQPSFFEKMSKWLFK